MTPKPTVDTLKDRRSDEDPIANIHRRMDTQDVLLTEIRDMIVAHIATEKEMKPALDELVSLWKGSKIMSRILATVCAGAAVLWALFVWAKDHLK